jgi:toxin HigB-1
LWLGSEFSPSSVQRSTRKLSAATAEAAYLAGLVLSGHSWYHTFSASLKKSTMNYRHAKKAIQRLDQEPGFTGGYSAALVRAFRMRMQLIRAAADERDFYALKSLHFEKLKGNRKHQYSMRLNDQFRLIVEIEKSREGNVIVVVDIEDYH